jgi:3-deoxy-manno-octulosonate cytidylyltransferase (CMP-KDO synthetase)
MGRVIVGIPARLGASRLPGKPLKRILDRTLIEHVWRRACLSEVVDEVFVAACDIQVQEVIESLGGNAVITDPEIPRPGLRVAAAMEAFGCTEDDIIVVVQGDEPLLVPAMIDQAVDAFRRADNALCACLMANCSEDEWLDPNEVKVLVDQDARALFMSRSPIPSNTRGRIGPRYKQVCIFPFTVAGLRRFHQLSPTPYEKCESIELLRAIEHGELVQMRLTEFESKSVDTEQDRLKAERIMRTDSVYPLYEKEPVAQTS